MEYLPLQNISDLVIDCSPQAMRTEVKITVAAGESVAKFASLATGESLTVHSPVNGKVASIENQNVTIIPDNSENDQIETLRTTTVDSPVAKLADAGLVGMGGSCFPASIKLQAAMKQKINTIIVNAVECEPYISIDEEIILNDLQLIQVALNYLGEVLQTDDFRFAVSKSFYKKHKEFFRDKKLNTVVMKSRYPAGAEKLIAKKVLGRKYSYAEFPFQAGLYIHNAATLRALGEYIQSGCPVTERPLSVIWNNNCEIRNIIVPVGAKVEDILKYVNVNYSETDEIIVAGGLMMGKKVSLDSHITKGTNALFIIKDKNLREYPCKMCGKCFDVCPMKLSPALIARTVTENEKLTKPMKKQINRCFLCGACSAACPSRIDLLKHIREGKELCRQ